VIIWLSFRPRRGLAMADFAKAGSLSIFKIKIRCGFAKCPTWNKFSYYIILVNKESTSVAQILLQTLTSVSKIWLCQSDPVGGWWKLYLSKVQNVFLFITFDFSNPLRHIWDTFHIVVKPKLVSPCHMWQVFWIKLAFFAVLRLL